MPRTPTLLCALVLLLPAAVRGQSSEPPKWDFAVTTGLFEGRPGQEGPSSYGDDWYTSARAAISVGRYWTPHLKTEAEVMTSGEGMRYAQRVATLPDHTLWPYGAQEYFRLSQGSARVVWQLLDNRWIHPYVVAGVTLDADRRHALIAEQYQYPGDTRAPGIRRLVAPQQTEEAATDYRVGAMVGAGAKLYLSSRTFANTAVLVTHAKPFKTVSFILGLGLDF